MEGKKRENLSKFLSLILRHRPEILNLVLLNNGYTESSIEEVVNRIQAHKSFAWVTIDDVKFIVDNDPKGRYEISDNRIRARYGHTKTDIKINYQKDEIPSILFHGTSVKAFSSIKKEGLIPKKRKHVHLTSSIIDAKHNGMRKSKDVILLSINTENLLSLGYEVKKAGKNVYIVPGVPKECIEVEKYD